MNKPDLPALVAYWQKALRLLDWRLQVDYVRDLATSDGRPCYGLCRPFVDARRAQIAIRDPETPLAGDGPSVEEALVHELTHLHFAAFGGRSPAEIAAEEQAVWSLAEALTSRGGKQAAMVARAMRAQADMFALRRAGGTMDPKLIKDALDALIAGDMQKCMEILKGIVAAVAGAAAPAEPPAAAAAETPPSEPDGDEAPPGPPADKAAGDPPAPPAEDKPKAAASPEMALAARVQALEAERAARLESEERAQLFAKRPDFGKEVRAMLERAPLAVLRDAVTTLPRGAAPRAAAEPARPPTRGAEQGAADAPRLPTAERAALDEQMGLRERAAPVRREGVHQILGVMTPSQARAFRAAAANTTKENGR